MNRNPEAPPFSGWLQAYGSDTFLWGSPPETTDTKPPSHLMQNWIGIGIWIVMGAAIGLLMRAAISRPEEQPGHAQVIMLLGAFAAVIGGMLGVGIFHLFDPLALSIGGMAGAVAFSVLMTFIYRWGLRTLL